MDSLKRSFTIAKNGTYGTTPPIDVSFYYSAVVTFHGTNSATTLVVSGSVDGSTFTDLSPTLDAYVDAADFNVSRFNFVRLTSSNSDGVSCTAQLLARAEDPGRIEDSNVFGCPETVADTSLTPDDAYGSQVVAFTATAQEVALLPNTSYRLVADQNCFVGFLSSGQSSVTSSTGMLLISELPEVFKTSSSRATLSIVRSSADGNLYITKMGV